MTDQALHWRAGRVLLRCARYVWNRPHVLVAFLCFVAIFYTYVESADQDKAIRTNQAQAIDQFCELAERAHLTDVQRLQEIYVYLDSLSRDQYAQPLNQFIIQSTLPAREGEAQTDRAPPLCDRKGFGLGEPDPEVPARPIDLTGPAFPPVAGKP